MTDGRIAAVCAAALFVGATLVGLLGADKPPPLGFLILVALLGAVSCYTYWRIKRRLTVRRAGGRGHVRRAALEGLVAGLVVGLLLVPFGGGEPSVAPSVGDLPIWFGVAGTIGALGAAIVWAVAARMQDRFQAKGRP